MITTTKFNEKKKKSIFTNSFKFVNEIFTDLDMSPWSKNTDPTYSFIITLTCDLTIILPILSTLLFRTAGELLVAPFALHCHIPPDTVILGTERVVHITAESFRTHYEMITVQ